MLNQMFGWGASFGYGLIGMALVGVLGGAILYARKGIVPFGFCVVGAVGAYSAGYWLLAELGNPSTLIPQLVGAVAGVAAANIKLPGEAGQARSASATPRPTRAAAAR